MQGPFSRFKSAVPKGQVVQKTDELEKSTEQTPRKNPQDTKCAYFWNSICIRTNGRLVPCCMYDDMEEAPNLKDFSGHIEQAYNSRLFKDMRRKSLNGEGVVGCGNCYFREKATGKSMRKRANEDWSESYNDDVSSLKNVISAEFFVGNVCNLKCNMCDPKFSNLLAKDHFKLGLVDSELTQPFENDYRETVKNLPNLKRIKFVGGEPLVNKAHWELLASIPSEQASQMCLEYATNCTIFPNQQQLKIWEKFKGLEIFLSIDGMGKTTEYIRFPSKWSKVEENAKKYSALLKDKQNCTLGINCVVSIYNISDLRRFVEWSQKNLPNLVDPHGNSTLIFSNLLHPEHLSIINLPDSVKRELLDLYPDDEIYSYVRSFLTEPGEPSKLKGLKNHTYNFDRIRGITFKDYIPEIAPMLNDL